MNLDLRDIFFGLDSSRLERCFAPGMTCEADAIRAHSIQNARQLDLLVEDGHVVQLTRRFEDGEPVIDFGPSAATAPRRSRGYAQTTTGSYSSRLTTTSWRFPTTGISFFSRIEEPCAKPTLSAKRPQRSKPRIGRGWTQDWIPVTNRRRPGCSPSSAWSWPGKPTATRKRWTRPS